MKQNIKIVESEQKNEVFKIVESFDSLPVAQRKDMFNKLEQELFKLPQLPDDAYQLKESYSGGLYCRQITIPAGVLITGRIYRFDHIEIMIKGKIAIISAENGKTIYEGHNVIQANAGKRQAGLAIEETTWVTINNIPVDMPINEMLDYTSVLSYEEYDEFYRNVDYWDFQKLLLEMRISQEQMNEIVNTKDLINMPKGYSHVYVGDSKLDGKGLFTSKEIKKGDTVCPARVKEKRTPAGRYSNHSLHPNTIPVQEGDVFYFVAKNDIEAGVEITCNYRDIIEFRQDKGDIK